MQILCEFQKCTTFVFQSSAGILFSFFYGLFMLSLISHSLSTVSNFFSPIASDGILISHLQPVSENGESSKESIVDF